MDAQREVTLESLTWDEDLPSGTDVEFQLAVSDSPDGPFEFVGPNGHWSTRFTGGEPLPRLVGRYIRYRCYLHSDGVVTPSVGDIQVGFSGLQPSSVTFYEYDPAGNRTRKVRQTNAGVVLEEVLDDESWAPEDRINNLNQLMRRDVTDSGGTLTWRYEWDPDGNMTGKTNGTDTFDYTWSDEGRLTRVEGPGGLDIEYKYDSMGRMLRRVDGADSWAFEWNGWDLVRETAPDGTVTRYFCPERFLHRFQRGTNYYSVHADALGCVRTITDAAGRVVSRFDYGAYGEELQTSTGSVSGSFPYGFGGAHGCRTDRDLELIYMRNRWYDGSLGRFLSRDPIGVAGGLNYYSYASGNPVSRVDPSGLDWETAVRENAVFIKGAAKAYGIPGWVLAATVAMENASSKPIYRGEAEEQNRGGIGNFSSGVANVKPATAAWLLGLYPKNVSFKAFNTSTAAQKFRWYRGLNIKTRQELACEIEVPYKNIAIAAIYLRRIKDEIFPDVKELSLDQWGVVYSWYNGEYSTTFVQGFGPHARPGQNGRNWRDFVKGSPDLRTLFP